MVSGVEYGARQSGVPGGAGYDLATGLGSINVANLLNLWGIDHAHANGRPH